MNRLTTRGHGATDIGLERSRNEDSLWVDDRLGLYIVSDGMGGHKGGHIASSMTVLGIIDHLLVHARLLRQARRGQRPVTDVARLLKDAVQQCNDRIFRMAGRACARMGCTVTAMVRVGDQAVIAHVGDSCLALVRAGQLRQITRDHSWAGEMMAIGAVTPAEVAESPYRNVLTRAVGVRAKVKVDIEVVSLHAHDRILLCSDGLTRYADTDALADMMTADLADIPTDMVSYANRAGGADNITAVVVEVVHTRRSRPVALAA